MTKQAGIIQLECFGSYLGIIPGGSMPFLVEIANGSMSSCHLFEAAFQVRLQRTAQADQLLAAAHLA